MKRQHTEEQIRRILREAEQAKALPDLLRQYGIAQNTYDRWSANTAGWSQDNCAG
jgi:hypothetical protein